MAAHENLNPKLFEAHLPPRPGTAPIPEGTMRFHHYTGSSEAAESIRAQGLLRSKAEESYARSGTEFPQTFATAGVPDEDALRRRPHIEGYAHTEQLDVGKPWLKMRGPSMAEEIAQTEASKNTITFHGDVPPEQIVAVHEPWHSVARYLIDDPQTFQAHVAPGGTFSKSMTGDEATDEALTRMRHFYRGAGQ